MMTHMVDLEKQLSTDGMTIRRSLIFMNQTQNSEFHSFINVIEDLGIKYTIQKNMIGTVVITIYNDQDPQVSHSGSVRGVKSFGNPKNFFELTFNAKHGTASSMMIGSDEELESTYGPSIFKEE